LKKSVSGNNLFNDMEGILERMTSGEVGSNMDKFVTGFLSSFERGYRQFERALSSKLGLSPRRHGKRSNKKEIKNKVPKIPVRKSKNSIHKRAGAV